MKKRGRGTTRSRKKSADGPDRISRDALSAWAHLRAVGGIEPDERDADLEERLRIALRPSSPSLEDALAQSSTDQLVKAFFRLLQPYVAMFRAILNFFQDAAAREGGQAWRIRIEDEHLDLKHFQRFVAAMDSLPCEFEVPAIDRHGGWAWNDARQAIDGLQDLSKFWEEGSHASTGYSDVDEWLEAYKQGQYMPFPASIHPATFEGPLQDMAAIAAGSVDIIRRTWRDRQEMLEEHRARRFESDQEDGFSPRTIAQEETDHRIFNMSICLAAFRFLSAKEQKMYADALQAELSVYPRRKLGIRGTSKALERILELPVWRKRHELYAVWVATEIVNAGLGHTCELHHENGRITFAFKETVIATFRSTYPTVRLYAERRSPLADPIGHGRKHNVQPDFGLWRGSAPQEECGLVIEVKHYKKDAPGRFREVLTDYGRAHPKAEIVLVSHGPARGPYKDAPTEIKKRYHVIGNLTAYHFEQRTAFAERVRAFLKEPVPFVAGEAVPSAAAIDISLSMSPALEDQDFLLFVKSLARNDSIPLLLVDSEIRCRSKLCDIEEAVRTTRRGNSTHLTPPLEELLRAHARVLVITDTEGLSSITGMAVKRIRTQDFRGFEVQVAVVSSS